MTESLSHLSKWRCLVSDCVEHKATVAQHPVPEEILTCTHTHREGERREKREMPFKKAQTD